MTRRTSQRARAQQIYREMTQVPNPIPQEPPEPPSPDGFGEQDLTARVRALYENSAVPVREIASLAGVTERTIYKYARKGGWTKRYAWIDAGGAKRRARRAASDADFAPVQGAGGRFIVRADKDGPVAAGVKATDPAGAARAGQACAQAETIAAQAQADAAWEQWGEAFSDWLRTVLDIHDQLGTCEEAARQRWPKPPTPEMEARERFLTKAGHLAATCLEFCQQQHAAAAEAMISAAGTARGAGSS